MLTFPCNLDPLTPHFYIVKLGFTGVYIFSYFPLKHRLWALFRTASLRRFLRVPSICFEQKQEKQSQHLNYKLTFLQPLNSQYIAEACLRNEQKNTTNFKCRRYVHCYKFTSLQVYCKHSVHNICNMSQNIQLNIKFNGGEQAMFL